MKKKLAFLIAVTPNLAFAAGNLAIALDKYMHREEYEAIIYYTSLSESDICAFKKIPRCELRQFYPKADMVDFLLRNLPSDCPYRRKNQLMLLAHYEIFDLLREYDAVVWLDADILVQGNLSEMLSYEPLGITADTPWLVRDQFICPDAVRLNKYNLDKEAVCTAVIAVHDSLPYEDIHQWLIEQTYVYADQMKNIDQVTINLMLQEFDILPAIMPLETFQCMPWKENAWKANIVHFGTADKVWKNAGLCKEFSEWFRNHMVWMELGGSDFTRNW